MLSGVQRVWGNEPSPFQVSSHCGSWSPKWTFKFLLCDCKGQNLSIGRVLYIIRKLLKCRCQKWACIAHLDVWNTSYDQKKSWESNKQFDSQPLKVKNWPDFLACRWHATHCWKTLDKGYNFALEFIAIEGLHAKLWAPKVTKVIIAGQKAIRMWPPWRGAEYTMREKVASTKSRPWWVLWVWVSRGSS
jgi:hypothetical protein